METKGTESPKERTLYLAGVFDSLGCVRIETPRKGELPCLYVWITSKHFNLMEMLQKMGAHVARKADGQYRAKWKEQRAHTLLKQIVPHLKMRKEQATCGLEFHENRKKDPTGENDQIYRLRLRLLKRADEGGE